MSSVSEWSAVEDGNTHLDQYDLERQINPHSPLNRYTKKIMAAVKAKTDAMQAEIDTLAPMAGVVHITGDETVGGCKTFEEPIVGDVSVAVPVPDGVTPTPRLLAERFADVVNVKDYGAVGDGVTDDTSAIAAAFTAAGDAGKSVFFPSGTYACTAVTATAGFGMDPNARLLYVGEATSEPFILVDSNSLSFGYICIDCNNEEVKRGIAVYGSDNYFESIKILNEYSDTILTTGIYVTGNSNCFDSIAIFDFVKGSYDNDSTPQGVVLSGAADGNYFADIYARNGRATVVNNSTGTNQFGTVASYNCNDNGFYSVAAGKSLVGRIIYDGNDAAFGARHSSTTIIGECIISKFGGGYALFFGNCERVDIGSIVATLDSTQTGNILGANSHFPAGEGERQGCGKITIGSVSGFLGQSCVAYLPESGSSGNNRVEYLSIGNIDVEQIIDTEQGNNRNFLYLDGCSGFNIGGCNFLLRVNPVDNIKLLYIVLPITRLDKRSRIGRVCIEQLQLDGTKETTSANLYGVRLQNYAGNSLIEVCGGYLGTSSGGLYCNLNDRLQDMLVATAAPTAGTWQKGTVVWNAAPASNSVGWSCSVAGTPGTWVSF